MDFVALVYIKGHFGLEELDEVVQLKGNVEPVENIALRALNVARKKRGLRPIDKDEANDAIVTRLKDNRVWDVLWKNETHVLVIKLDEITLKEA